MQRNFPLRASVVGILFFFTVGFLTVSTAWGAPASSFSSALRRYPYLTDVVGPYATINWATDRSESSGGVRYGKVGSEACTAHYVSGAKTAIAINSVLAYQWKAQLNLQPGAQYCYRVYLGTSPAGEIDLLGSDPAPSFQTQVPSGSTQSFSFIVFGDWGQVDSSGVNPSQASLMSLMAASGARFAVTTGDNGYPSGSQTNFGDLIQSGSNISAIFGPSFWKVPGASLPFFMTQGNHGISSSDISHPALTTWPEDRAVSTSGGRYVKETYCCVDGTTSASYPSAWYAFDAGPARFYVLQASWSDSNVGTASDYQVDYDYHWAPSTAQYQWLQADLAAHPSVLKFAFLHYPIYSDSPSQVSDTFLQGSSSLEGLLKQNGVDIAFSGHAHHYERNLASAAGVINYITGGGGATLGSLGTCTALDAYAIKFTTTGKACGSAPVPTSADQVYHFLKVTVNGTNVTVTPINALGQSFDVMSYSFIAGKESTPPSTPTGLTATVASGTQINLSWSASSDNTGVRGYDIYRDGDLINTVDANTLTYSDTNLTPSTTYSYQVNAFDGSGNHSALSTSASATTPSTASYTFTAVADAYVSASSTTSNFGLTNTLRAQGSPDFHSYIRFNVGDLSGTVTHATLRLYTTSSSATGYQVKLVNSQNWEESSITFANAPTLGSVIGSSGNFSSNNYTSADVTSLVTGNGIYDLAVTTTSSSNMNFNSREASSNLPQLVIETVTTPPPTPTPTSTSPAGGNLVLNPGFEIQGSGGVTDAANWVEGTNHIRASDKFHTGSWALHSTYRGAGTNTHTAAPIAVSPNTTYTYSGYIWRTDATGGACLDMNDILGETQLCTSTAGSWQFLTGTWNSGSNTSVTLRMVTDGSPTGDMWFDDISLVGPGGLLATDTPTSLPAATDTPADTATPSPTNSPAATDTITLTPTATGTPVMTDTATDTITPSPTASETPTPTNTLAVTDTPTFTPTASDTPSPTATASVTPTTLQTPTPTNSPVATDTATSTPTLTDTPVPTDTPTATSTMAATSTMTATTTPIDTVTPSPTNSPAATDTATFTPTATNTLVPTGTPTMTNTITPSPTATASQTPTPTNTLAVTDTATVTPTATLTPSPTATQTPTPTNSPTATSTSTATPTAGSGGVLIFSAAADAKVSEASPTTNFGTATTLLVDGGTGVRQNSFIRFNASGISGSIQSARLRVFTGTDSTTNGPAAYLADNTWTESGSGGVTWNTQPALLSGAFDNKGSMAASTWIEYDVTALVTGNGTYTFALVADSTDGVNFSSREGSNPPQLVVTFGTGGPTPTATPASPTFTPTPTSTPVATNTPTSTPTPANTPVGTNTPTPTATPTSSSGSMLIFTTVADAKVSEASPTTNFGTATTFNVDGGTGVRQNSFIRFTVSGVSGTIQSVKLRVRSGSDGTANGPAAYLADSNWIESGAGGVTWNTQPALLSGAFDNKTSIATNTSVDFDVTALVIGNGAYTFALVADSTDGINFSSREGATPPQLIVTFGP